MTSLRLAERRAPARILIIYGSCRKHSSSRRLAAAARDSLLRTGAEVAMYEPCGLPLDIDHSPLCQEVQELHRLVAWSDGQIWCAPEHHATMSGVMKLALDYFPTEGGGRSSAKGKALSLMQVSGGVTSFNAIHDMLRVGRSLGMYLAPQQVSLGQVANQFDSDGKLMRAELAARLQEAMDELVKLSLMLRESPDRMRAGQDQQNLAAKSGVRAVS